MSYKVNKFLREHNSELILGLLILYVINTICHWLNLW